MSSVLGLKVSPKTASVLPARLPPQAAAILSAIRLLRASLTRSTVSTIARSASGLARSAHQCLAVLGETRTAKTGAGVQKLAADAAIESDAAGDVLNIGAQRLAQIGDLVDEGYLGREKGVGRVFDQLGGLYVGEQHRRLDQIERPVELAHDGPRPLAVGADHHSVGTHEIVDRRALAQKLRVGGNVKAVVGQGARAGSRRPRARCRPAPSTWSPRRRSRSAPGRSPRRRQRHRTGRHARRRAATVCRPR